MIIVAITRILQYTVGRQHWTRVRVVHADIRNATRKNKTYKLLQLYRYIRQENKGFVLRAGFILPLLPPLPQIPFRDNDREALLPINDRCRCARHHSATRWTNLRSTNSTEVRACSTWLD